MISEQVTIEDFRGSITKHRTDFIVGVDNSLLRFKSLFLEKQRAGLARVEDVQLDRVVVSGIFGTVHLVDVSHDDPEQFFFDWYGPQCRFEGGKSLHGRPVSQVAWSTLRDHALKDYQRIKRSGAPDLSQVDLVDNQLGLQTVYRRLVLPLSSGAGRQVTHLLVGAVGDVQDRVPHTLEQRQDIELD